MRTPGGIFFALILLYNFVMSMIVSFIELAGKQFSSGMMMPLLLGKFQVPQEEYRVFLFMDLQSSTTIAEQLGHVQYSAFIRECFLDINSIASKYKGQIYQYVGDEVVLAWDGNDVSKHVDCIHFFFDCVAHFNTKSAYYQKRYGLRPVFKAGAHVGMVTAVEVGEIKRDIAYHGDTLNTAARLQSICNEYGQILMISASLASPVKDLLLSVNFLGSIRLKGKNTSLDIFGVASL